ncbi:MAG: glycosyltransferase [Coleofasciculaceae cyanobacterium SM2_1_6]|nr:glycosyltransferase [Coleofasciculaceae cyanobacterium SM2_1_6]
MFRTQIFVITISSTIQLLTMLQKPLMDIDRLGLPYLQTPDQKPQTNFPWTLIVSVGLLGIDLVSGQLGWGLGNWLPGGSEPWRSSLLLLIVAQLIMSLSPQPRRWSRMAIVTLLLGLTFRYIFWRGSSTLNLRDPLNGAFSLTFLGMELLIIFNATVQLLLFLRERDRRPEADRYSTAVLDGSFQPSIDILIPTYNEPAFVLRRTVIGCQALDYAPKQVYLLDDTNRPQIRQLAEDLGCEYITRLDNLHAKAGNLNNALRQTHGELIAVFDADFVPTKNFLTRTVGFFQDRTIALLQTHQSFFNPDPAVRNLGLEKFMTHEVEIFSRYYQPLRDGAETALCYGSSFVVRREALEAIDGFVTGTVSEDYLTGINLASRGSRVIYLDESLSAGVVPDNMAGHIAQRQRWARGTTQAFFVKSNPLTIPGLTLKQRLAHLEGILQWFTSLFQVAFLLVPLAYFGFGLLPLQTTPAESVDYFLPYYLIQLATFGWLNRHSRSAFMSMVYSVISCFPVAITVVHTLFRPFSGGFKVTPKGTVSDRSYYNWLLASPILVIFGLTLRSVVINFSRLWTSSSEFSPQTTAAIQLGLFWGLLNLVVEALVLIAFWDVPKLDRYEWLPKNWMVDIEIDTSTPLSNHTSTPLSNHTSTPLSNHTASSGPHHNQVWSGMTTRICEAGAEITLLVPNHLKFPMDFPAKASASLVDSVANFSAPAGDKSALNPELVPIKLYFPQQQLTMTGQIQSLEKPPQDVDRCASSLLTKILHLQISFDPENLPQQRKLIENLFCQPGQWQPQSDPGELKMLGLMVRALFYPLARWRSQLHRS